uniref:Uncharacterized protein n=1 Tax=Picea glauca TaxID=3330 RepID=A0A101M4N5_PICGL|nr:hypothetical protein ABT39_MTgene666 [Picea glauca]QHR87006.1 hypothetical protein Q903MT_gene1015 [Picea sitchensis]
MDCYRPLLRTGSNNRCVLFSTLSRLDTLPQLRASGGCTGFRQPAFTRFQNTCYAGGQGYHYYDCTVEPSVAQNTI